MDISLLQERFKDAEFRCSDHESVFKDLAMKLKTIENKPKTHENLHTLTEIFRVLRNSCIDCKRNQLQIMDLEISSCVIKYITDYNWTSSNNTDDKICLAGLQFLGNFVAGNEATREHLWKIGFSSFFTHFINENAMGKKSFMISTMILHNCLLEKHLLTELYSSSDGENLVLTLCNSLVLESLCNEWVLFCITENLFGTAEFFPLVFSKCPTPTQTIILQVYCDWMKNQSNQTKTENSDALVICFVTEFLSKFDAINRCYSVTEGDCFKLIVESLCWATAINGSWKDEISDTNIVEKIIILLKGMIQASNNKPTENNENDIETGNLGLCRNFLKSYLKRDLIRLIGNLCYKNFRLQNDIRSLGGIPLVLEACSIDDSNPFMQQWAVFAIRNLCENNPVNQSEIAKLEKLGMGDSPVLKSMGLTAVEDDHGRMKVIKKL